MLHQNYGKSHRELFAIAERVLSRSEDVTASDVKIATDSGFVTWDVDCDHRGYYPVPTVEYTHWDKIINN